MTQESEVAYAVITSRAADIANQMFPQYRDELRTQGLEENLLRRVALFVGIGNYYRPKPASADSQNFGLLIDYNFEGIIDPESRRVLRQTFKKIAVEAIRQAASENATALQAAIIAEARLGRNYFASFKERQQLFSPNVLPTLPKAKQPRRKNVKTLDDPEGEQGTLF